MPDAWRDAPSGDGVYWFQPAPGSPHPGYHGRGPDDAPPVVVQVTTWHSMGRWSVLYPGTDVWSDVATLRGRWFGPLVPPAVEVAHG